jgi:hypothetical protein
MRSAAQLEKALAPLREAFVRWCEAEDLVPDLTAPHGQAFEAGWNAAIREAVSRV